MTRDSSKRYRVTGWPAIAVYVTGLAMSHLTDEYGDSYEEPVEGMVVVVMVGDDAKHIVDIDDLVELDEDDYCSGCGQIGCGWC